MNQWKRADGDVVYGNDGIIGAIAWAASGHESTHAPPEAEYTSGPDDASYDGGGGGRGVGGGGGSGGRAALFEPQGRNGSALGSPRSPPRSSRSGLGSPMSDSVGIVSPMRSVGGAGREEGEWESPSTSVRVDVRDSEVDNLQQELERKEVSTTVGV